MQPGRRFEFGERFERLVLPLIQSSESIVRPSRRRQRLDRLTKSVFGVRIAPQLYERVGERKVGTLVAWAESNRDTQFLQAFIVLPAREQHTAEQAMGVGIRLALDGHLEGLSGRVRVAAAKR